MIVFRYIVGPILGICAAFLFAELSLNLWPDPGTATILGVMWIIAAGTFGGLVCAIIAPAHKIAIASGTGFLFGTFLLTAWYLFGQGQLPRDTNPLLWFWPIWLLPSYLFGGFIGNMFRRST